MSVNYGVGWEFRGFGFIFIFMTFTLTKKALLTSITTCFHTNFIEVYIPNVVFIDQPERMPSHIPSLSYMRISQNA